MRVKRLLVPGCRIEDGRALLTDEVFHHAIRVMRLGVGASLELVDGAGGHYSGRIERVGRQELVVAIDGSVRLPPEPRPHLTLLYGLAKRERTEWALQKTTELGVDCIVPCLCSHSVFRPRDRERINRRWLEIVRQATRQSERFRLPRLDSVVDFSDALRRQQGSTNDGAIVRLIADLSDDAAEPSRCLKRMPEPPEEVICAVGPEGGFSAAERSAASAAGFVPLSLGPNVLRSETAAIAATVLLLSYFSRL